MIMINDYVKDDILYLFLERTFVFSDESIDSFAARGPGCRELLLGSIPMRRAALEGSDRAFRRLDDSFNCSKPTWR